MTTVSTPRKVATAATAGATLAKGTLTPVNATAGPLTMTLPTTAAAGVEVSVEKTDASVNAVTVTGTLRGVASQSISLSTQFEARTFLSEGSGSWRPISDHRTTASLSATYAGRTVMPPAVSAHRLWPQLTVLQAFNAGHAWFASGTIANANDTTDFVLGDRCMSVTTDGAAGFSSYFKGAVTLNMTGKGLVVWLKAINAANMQFLSVDIANETGMTNRYRASLPAPGGSGKSPLFEGQWVPLFIPFSHFVTASGTPNPAAITFIQIIASDFGGGNPTTLKLGGVSTYTEGLTKFPNGVVTFSFDDSYATAWTVGVPKLAQRGYPATLYPIIDQLGQAGRLTLAQVKAMQVTYGWEIGGHCMTQAQHVTMVGGNAVLLDQMLTDIRAWQAANGFVGSSFAYPIGPFDEQAVNIARQHFAYARTNDGQPYTPWLVKPHVAPALALGSGTTLATAKAVVDRVVAAKSGVHFVFHDLNSNGGLNDWTVADFQALVDYVAASGAAVATATDVMASR